MDLSDGENHIRFDDNEHNQKDGNDSILPLTQRMKLKTKNTAEQTTDENTVRTERERCKRNKRKESKRKNQTDDPDQPKKSLPDEDALDAINTWLLQKYEKENKSILSSTELNDKQTENELKMGPDNTEDPDKCSNVFHNVNKLHEARRAGEKSRKRRHKTDEKVSLDSVPGSPTFPRNEPKSVSRIGRKSKKKTAVSEHKRRHVDVDDKVKNPTDQQVVICDDDEDVHCPKKITSNRIVSDSDDDIIEVCGPTAVSSSRRLGSRRAKKSRTPHTPIPCTPGGTFGRSASPATMLLVNQLEDDEMMARRLQEEFDAEQIADSLAPAQGVPLLPSFVHQPTLGPRANSIHQRYPMLQHPTAAYMSGWSPVDYNMALDPFYRIQPALQNYVNMMYPRPRGGRGRGRNANRHRRGYSDESDEQDNGNNYETLMALAERLGPAIEKGLSALEISQLPTFLYTPDCKMRNKSCSICMADYETGDSLRKLPCFHDYHDTCIDQWLVKNPDCPICRVEVQI